jgi:hypothetical protein
MIQKIILPFLLLGTSFISSAQSITAVINTKKDAFKIRIENLIQLSDTIRIGSDTTLPGGDTVRIGSMLIVNKNAPSENRNFKTTIRIGDSSARFFNGDFKKTKIELSRGPKQLKNLQTNWWTLDLGFANFNDKSPDIYWLAANTNFTTIYPGPVTAGNLSLNNKKSSNVNIWVVQQKLNLYKHKINLKYGIGVEMFNFRFEKSVSFREDVPGFIKYDDVVFSKNKLLVKYLTIPVQINFTPNPSARKAFYASIGMSAGYLLNAKNKQISTERGKEKFEGNFNLNDWRIATIGELGLGPVRLYGSYGMNNLFNKSQSFYDLQPFALGLRFSRF